MLGFHRTTRRESVAPAGMSPRLIALELLREKIAMRQAGLDPYRPSDLIVKAGPNEVKCFEGCCKQVAVDREKVGKQSLFNGGMKFRVTPTVDALRELGLDGLDAPLMLDEPLASRAVTPDEFSSFVMAAIAAIERQQAPVSLDAMRTARAAYDERYPHGADDQLVIRTDGAA